MLDYFDGQAFGGDYHRAGYGFEDALPMGIFFRKPAEFLPIEVTALQYCRGHVPDIGAGSGRDSLALSIFGSMIHLHTIGHKKLISDEQPEMELFAFQLTAKDISEQEPMVLILPQRIFGNIIPNFSKHILMQY